MNSNEIKSLANSIKLTDQQRAILVGLMLGDGHLETQNKGRTFRLKVEHSINQKDYVDWLYDQFKELVLTKPQIKEQEINGVTYQKYWFSTISIGEFRFYGKQFYPKGKKIVPEMTSKLVTPLSLAIWFMDDGSLKSSLHKARVINTQGFGEQDLKRLQKMLAKKFGIITTLRKQKEGKQIYILSAETEKFISLIKPFVIPSMEYKIKLT